MKYFFTIVASIILLFPLKGQADKWPYQEFQSARAFMYNQENQITGNYAIIQDGKINPSATSEGVLLSAGQIKKALGIINSNVQGLLEGLSKTFVPHHAIVFYDKNAVPVASVMMGFESEGIRLQPAKKGKTLIKELSKKEIEDQQNKLAGLQIIIEELGLSVDHFFLNFNKVRSLKINSQQVKNLELFNHLSIKQLVSDRHTRFDLSGMVMYEDKILAIADKEWDKFIYQIDTLDNKFSAKSFQPLCFKGKLDLEGIEYCNGRFYLIEEYESEVYYAEPGNCEMTKLNIPWEKYGIDRSDWGNKGFEGIAIDCINQVLYLAKEREERNIFRIDLSAIQISEPFIEQLKTSGGHDISDLKFESPYLYVLERGLGLVTRINTKSGETKSVSFQSLVFKNGQRMFKNDNPQFGMAEALMLTRDEIWIGFDNNGDPVSDYGKTMGLDEGTNTVLIIFERPEGF
jgi:uncharacterized protein YjiK